MGKKKSNSFEFIGAAFNNKYVNATNATNSAFTEEFNLFNKTYKNNFFEYSKGNAFEYIQGAKFKAAGARAGKWIRFNPVNDARGLHTSPDDFVTYNFGQKIHYQFKAYDNPEDMIKAMAGHHHKYPWDINTRYVGPIDNYGDALKILRSKYRNGTISKDELFVYKNLRPGVVGPDGSIITTSNRELNMLKGPNGKISMVELNRFKEYQVNKAFAEECLQNTASVTFVSAITGCVFSTVSNVYKYVNDEQDIKTTAKNIGIDTVKAAGHGILSSSIANGFKYIGFKTGSEFLHESVNSLVIANGTIDVGKSIFDFSKGNISSDDLFANIICSTAMTTINLALNAVLVGHPFIKLVSTIVLNQFGRSFLNTKNKENKSSQIKCISLENNLIAEIELENINFKKYLNTQSKILDDVNRTFLAIERLDDGEIKEIFIRLNIGKQFISRSEFKRKLLTGDTINMIYKKD